MWLTHTPWSRNTQNTTSTTGSSHWSRLKMGSKKKIKIISYPPRVVLVLLHSYWYVVLLRTSSSTVAPVVLVVKRICFQVVCCVSITSAILTCTKKDNTMKNSCGAIAIALTLASSCADAYSVTRATIRSLGNKDVSAKSYAQQGTGSPSFLKMEGE
jgi:hypothetical protein